MAGTIHVEFSLPEELDLVYPYITKQMEAFDKDGLRRPTYRVLLGEDVVVVELKNHTDV